nr:MAG TPA: Mitochondrial genome maintenance exonuclease 1, DNA complex, DNA exonuclease [Caudoviricetes sp.]
MEEITTWNIKGHIVEFIDDIHQYLVDGCMVDSVTQILGVKYRNDYASVPPAVLDNASKRGTAVHKAIENFNVSGYDDGSEAVRNFKFLQKQYGFEVLDSELPIVIFKDDMPIACGRLDMTMLMDGKTGIADIKTVSSLNKEKIAYQLNLYRIGLMQSYGVDAKFLKIIHLRDGIRKVIDCPVNEGMAWELINKFLNEKR